METRSSKANALKRKLQLEKRLQENEKARKLDDSSQSCSENSMTSIDILNDDVLLMIFRYLTIKERITIERVSKKWKELSLMSWVNFKKINLAEDICDGFSVSNVKDILRKGREYLTHLSFENLHGEITPPDYVFASINLCTNLTHLNFPLYFHGSDIRLNKISKKVAENLKSLKIRNSSVFGRSRDADLLRLLEKTTNLEEFTVSIEKSNGSFLTNLTDKCKTLSICRCQKFESKNLVPVLKRLKNLEHLNISYTKIVPETVASVSNQLISLNLSSSDTFFSDNTYKSLSFPNLRTLNLSGTAHVNDDILCNIIKKCPLLEDLNLGWGEYNENCFRKLALLKNLTRLSLRSSNITDDAIMYLAPRLGNLKEVNCIWVTSAKTSALLHLIEFCPSLESLSIGPSKLFTSKFFELSEKCVLEKLSNLPFKIQLRFFDYRPMCDSEFLEFKEERQAELERLLLKLIEPKNDVVSRCIIVENSHGIIKKLTK